MRSILRLLILFMVSQYTIGAELINGGFEKVITKDSLQYPSGWSISQNDGQLHSPGYESEYCLTVKGNGENDAAWLSDALSVEPGQYYEFAFWGKAETGTSGGSAVSGPTFCNRDYRLTDSWEQYSYVFRVPDDEKEARFRLGQWHVDGELYFDEAALLPIQPIHNTRYNISLGAGERTDGNSYTAKHVFSGEGSNFCRFLKSTTAGFNSNRWVFGPSSTVIYRHELPGNRFTKASLSLSVNYYQAGICKIYARQDQKEWKTVASIDGLSTESIDLPIPKEGADSIEVKLEGINNENGQCSFQINQYEFEAELQKPVPTIQGDTQYLRIVETDPRFTIEVLDFGNPKPGMETNALLSVENRTDRERRLTFYVEIDGVYTRVPQKVEYRIPAEETVTVRIPYMVSETGQKLFRIRAMTHSGIFLYEAHVSHTIPFLYSNDYGEIVESNAEADFWWCPAMYKISQSRPAPDGQKGDVKISAARGEFEPVQVIIRPRQPLANVVVQVEDLRGLSNSRIDESNISIKQVEYVEVMSPSDSIGCVGFWPDPLPPVKSAMDLEAGRNYPFWITVYIPRDANAGEYDGNVTFKTNNWQVKVPIQLTVFDFEIPEHPSLRSAFGFSSGNVRRYHGLEDSEQFNHVVDLYLKNFRDHRISPYNPTMLHPIESDLEKGEDGKLHFTFEFEDFDRAGERYFDEFGFTSLRLPLAGMGGGTFHSRRKGKIGDHEQGTPEHERLFHEYASTIEDHLKQKGWLEKAFVYWFDEPTPKDYEFVREGMDMIHRHAPELTRFLTEQPEEELFGYVDTWCPVLHHADPEICRPRIEKGEKIWSYVCTGPKEPYPGLFIDHHAVELRTWIWMTHKYGYHGCLVWQSNYWTSRLAYPSPALQDPWKDPMSYVTGYGRPVGFKGHWGNGDGRFIYPPQNWNEEEELIAGPVDSFRWEMLREGMEDYEYFTLIKQRLNEGDLSSAQRRKAKELLEIPEEIIRTRTEYSKDPKLYYDYRERVGRFLEKIRLN